MGVILFDMDGVIVNSEVAYMEQLKNFMNIEGIYLSEEQHRMLIGSSRKQAKEMYINWLGPTFSYDEFIIRLDKYYNEHPLDYAKIANPGLFKVLSELKNRSFKMSLVSSSRMEEIIAIVNALGIKKYFDNLISGEQFEESKPNPAIYNYAKSKYSLEDGKIYVVEDSPYGIEAAKRASLPVIALKDRHFGMDQSRADYIIEDLIEILDIVD